MWPVIANNTNLWQDVEFVDVSFLQSNLAPNLCVSRRISVQGGKLYRDRSTYDGESTLFGGHIVVYLQL